jgi:hypothetical protein
MPCHAPFPEKVRGDAIVNNSLFSYTYNTVTQQRQAIPLPRSDATPHKVCD